VVSQVFDRVLVLDSGVARRGHYRAGELVAGGTAPEWPDLDGV
jgi:hypothetical protein